MQHDHVLKKLNSDLLNSSPGLGVSRDRMQETSESVMVAYTHKYAKFKLCT